MPRDSAEVGATSASEPSLTNHQRVCARDGGEQRDAGGAVRHHHPPNSPEKLPQPVDPRTPAPFSPNRPEPYVDATAVAQHLAIRRREVLDLTRKKKLPGHPIDPEAVRKTWRYRLSEIDRAMRAGAIEALATPKRGLGAGPNSGDNADGSSRSQRRKNSDG